jgi:hypothetical protein
VSASWDSGTPGIDGCPRKTTLQLGVPLSVQSVIRGSLVVAAIPFAPGHLGELTQIVPFEMVDAVLESTRTVQANRKLLTSPLFVNRDEYGPVVDWYGDADAFK